MGLTFVITELVDIAQGDGTYTFVDSGVQFNWDAQHQSSPRDGWNFGLKQRTRREDYVGSDAPTEQVLGPNFKPFTLKGRWDNKYNPEDSDFAWNTYQSFEKLVQRGNAVRITFDGLSVTGLITDADFNYRRRWDIGYEFTVSPHYRNTGGDVRRQKTVVPQAVSDPQTYADQAAQLALQARALHNAGPALYIAGTLYADVGTNVNMLIDRTATVQSILDTRVLAVDPSSTSVNAVSRLVQSFKALASASQDIIDQVQGSPTNTALAYESAMNTLGFEEWSRELAFTCRQLMLTARQAAQDLATRVTPKTLALYRPNSGESLYGISNRFYQTPDRWRDIYAANNLTSFTLTGLEMLSIPDLR
jgi:hypothetical protein